MMSRDDDHTDTHVTVRPALSGLPVRRFVLRVVEGPNQGLAVVLDGSSPMRLLVGKSPACDLKLDDPEVSRRHVALAVTDDAVHIMDLASTNGTQINGLRVGSAFLKGGEQIWIGRTKLLLEDAGQTSDASSTGPSRFGGVLGESPAMRRLYPLCAKLAQANVPVIIEGESGTGKEELARAIHAEGPRRDAPFIVFDCTAVSPNLIESELFGHERGAFTGSVRTRLGVFERASGGTLLIDEIGDMPLELQPKLLRVVERGEVTRVGDDVSRRVDVRLLTATRRDLDQEVASGRFRDDLFHRIAVARIELPPLRQRRGDVRLLARSFWTALGGDTREMPVDLLSKWDAAPWPGNVRELRNAVARRIALGDLAQDEVVSERAVTGAEDVTPRAVVSSGDTIARVLADDLPLADARQRVIDELEARYVARILELHDGDIDRAAAAAGVARRHFFRLKAKASGRS